MLFFPLPTKAACERVCNCSFSAWDLPFGSNRRRFGGRVAWEGGGGLLQRMSLIISRSSEGNPGAPGGKVIRLQLGMRSQKYPLRAPLEKPSAFLCFPGPVQCRSSGWWCLPPPSQARSREPGYRLAGHYILALCDGGGKCSPQPVAQLPAAAAEPFPALHQEHPPASSLLVVRGRDGTRHGQGIHAGLWGPGKQKHLEQGAVTRKLSACKEEPLAFRCRGRE